MLNEPLWVTPEGVIRLNELSVRATGEPHQLRSMDLLAGACERPKNHWHYSGVQDVVVLGATLLFAVARNHPFLQGNKRTAFLAMIGFFGGNGYRFNAADHSPNAEYIIAAIEGRMTDEEFIEAIRHLVERWPPPK